MNAVGGWYRIEGIWHRIAEATKVPRDFQRRTRVVTACRKVALAWPKEKIGYIALPSAHICGVCEDTHDPEPRT